MPTGGVLGAQATRVKPTHRGVLGAAANRIGRVATTGTLPFTGLPLWIATLIALAMIGVGLTARRVRANHTH